MDIEMLRFRAHIQQKIRAFFIENDYLEVDTPALAKNLIPETCLEIFKTQYLEPWSHKRHTWYLVPSPEIYLKQIIAQHTVSLFQLSKCYRNVESRGNTHSPEFTLLEYYTMNASYRESAQLTEKLLCFLNARFEAPFLRVTMNEAFEKLAGFALYDCDEKMLHQKARALGLESGGCNNWDDLYQLIFVHAIEPHLGELAHMVQTTKSLQKKGQPLFLMDYPAKTPCLAKDANKNCKERWELYIDGLELANCYSEETDAQKVRSYFAEEGRRKKSARVRHAIDKNYWHIFEKFPACSGVALGVDRLLMVLAEKKSLDSVLPFPL